MRTPVRTTTPFVTHPLGLIGGPIVQLATRGHDVFSSPELGPRQVPYDL